MVTSYRQEVVQRCLSISFPAALRQERQIAESDAHVARRQINSFSVNVLHLNQYVPLRTSGLRGYSKATVQHGNDTCSSGGWDMDGDWLYRGTVHGRGD